VAFGGGGNKGAVAPDKKYLEGKLIILNRSVSCGPNAACDRVTSPAAGFWLLISTNIIYNRRYYSLMMYDIMSYNGWVEITKLWLTSYNVFKQENNIIYYFHFINSRVKMYRILIQLNNSLFDFNYIKTDHYKVITIIWYIICLDTR